MMESRVTRRASARQGEGVKGSSKKVKELVDKDNSVVIGARIMGINGNGKNAVTKKKF